MNRKKGVFKEKNCTICHKVFVPMSGSAKICRDCDNERFARNITRNFPFCYSCQDKGWNSYLAVENISADFPGDRTISSAIMKRNYCGCKGGQKLKALEINEK